MRIASKLKEITFHVYGIDIVNESKLRNSIRSGWPSKSQEELNKLLKTEFANVVFHGRVPQEEFNSDIKNFNCGLTLNSNDEFSELTAKSA